jgi:myo-inositol-1(or 4)-monophosphatase
MKNEMYDFALEIAKIAGKMSIDLRKEPLKLETKRSHADLVTFIDKEVEQFLVNKILERYPQHGILGEEGTFKESYKNFETVWIIDPIDGTTNFVHQQQHYAISIAIAKNGIGIFGVVYDPIKDELFYAGKDDGAYLNGNKIILDDKKTIRESVISTCMFWEDPNTKENLSKTIIGLARDSRGIRMMSSAALDMCYVAIGRLDAYINPRLQAWDFSAAKIILEEAEGFVRDHKANIINTMEGSSMIACNPSIYEELLNYF